MSKTLQLNELKSNEGARKRSIRVGRGESSGKGKTSGRGHKGQQSRSGGGFYVGFEGGQTPLYRRIPKLRGFKNFFKKKYFILNLQDIEKLKLTEVNLEILQKNKVANRSYQYLKVLGQGELKSGVQLKVHAISKSAREKVEAAGGKVELIQIASSSTSNH